ncbi:MAG TPA: hypothetical protein VIR05_05555 [Luteimonas sp.]
MTVASSKWMLAAIWLVGAGGVFLLLVAQSLLGRYEPATHEVWGWFLPTVMPTLSLIVGVLVADRRAAGKGQDARQAGKPVDDLFFRLGAGMSVLYLLLVALSVLVQPLLPQATPLELMQRSNLWLGPLQGLTVATLGVFFRSQG